MANTLYPKAKQSFLTGEINLTSDTVKIQLIDLADYTYSAAHDNLDDVPAAGRVGTAVALASKTVTDGVFDAADATFAAVSGDVSEALIIYKDTGTESTSKLIAFIDAASSGLPVTPNTGNITVTFDSGTNKIFAL